MGAIISFYVVSDDDHIEVVVGRHADVAEVFRDVARFSSEMPKGRGFEKFDKFMGVQTLAQTDGEPHDRIRRLLMPAFSSRSMLRLEGRITEIVDGMLDRIARKGTKFDGIGDYAANIIVAALLDAMLHLDEEQKGVFLALHAELFPLTTYTKAGEAYPPDCVAAFQRAREMVERIIIKRRDNPGDDFISELILARDQGDKLDDEELFNQAFTVCGAALSATSRAMGGVLYTIYTHRDQLGILLDDLEPLDSERRRGMFALRSGRLLYVSAHRHLRYRARRDENSQGHDRAPLAAGGESRPAGLSGPFALRCAPRSAPDSSLRLRRASLHRQ